MQDENMFLSFNYFLETKFQTQLGNYSFNI